MIDSIQCRKWNSPFRRHLANATALVVATLVVPLVTVPAVAQLARAQRVVHPKWMETPLYEFHAYGDADNPAAGLIQDSQGNLYGTTENGGADASGAVFKVDLSGNETILYSFTDGTDGGTPLGDLVQDAQGNLYGTAYEGGNLADCSGSGCGVVFELSPGNNGVWNETVLYNFTAGTDGGYPEAGLVRDAAGNLYGTTYYGGDLSCRNYGCGVVFKLSAGQNGVWSETALHAFTGGTDGAYPNADLMLDKHGNVYGVTEFGGNTSQCVHNQTTGCGVVFELNPKNNWSETVQYTFQGGTDGAFPRGRLALNADGNLYGVTAAGGNLSDCESEGCGVVFKLNSSGETPLYTYTGGADGASPTGVNMTGATLWGTTTEGGDTTGECVLGCGVVFKLDANTGAEKVLYAFEGYSDGGDPVAPPLRDKATGNLYGTTLWYGEDALCEDGCGVVFEVQNTKK